MALPKDTSSVNARSLSKDFESKGREGYYEAAAKLEDSVPDLGNVFKQIQRGGIAAQIAITRETEIAMNTGNSSVAAAFSAAQGGMATQKELEKKRAEDAKLMAHLALLNALNDRIADLGRQMAAMDADMRAKYGDDYLDKFYSTYIGEPKEGQSDEEKLDELAKVMLDENGNVRPEFENNDMAQYLAKRDDRMRAQDAVSYAEQTGDYSRAEREFRKQGLGAADQGALSNDSTLNSLYEQEQEERIDQQTSKIENNQTAFNFSL